jgi:hypothetical protein
MIGRCASTMRPGCGVDAANAGDGGEKPSVLMLHVNNVTH